jgi:nitroreductase
MTHQHLPTPEAIRTRRSIRAFLKTPVPRETIAEILELAGWAPSGSNIQPWRVHVLTGATLERVGSAIRNAYLTGEPGHKRDYAYYTDPIVEPYLARRRQCGWGLYTTLGIQRGEKERMTAARARNYNFFGAPMGLVFSIDANLEKGSWLDYGMFLQTIMIAARSYGLHTCPQASIAEFPDIVRRELAIEAGNIIICGMAVGYADPDAVVNQFQPPRIPLTDYVTFCG